MRIGLDIGSTTMKCVVLDGDGTVVYRAYERHYSEITKKASDMLGAIDRALGAYANRDFFAELRQRCMAEDFSWGRSANEYIRMYRELIKG